MGPITGLYFPISSVVLGCVVDDDRHESGARWFNAQKTRHILSVATVYTMGAGRGCWNQKDGDVRMTNGTCPIFCLVSNSPILWNEEEE